MKGQTFAPMLGHARPTRATPDFARNLSSRHCGSPQTYFTFEDTLTQIGLGYVFLFLLAFTRPRTQVVALVLILICFWAAFAHPAPGPQFDYARVGVPANWSSLLQLDSSLSLEQEFQSFMGVRCLVLELSFRGAVLLSSMRGWIHC